MSKRCISTKSEVLTLRRRPGCQSRGKNFPEFHSRSSSGEAPLDRQFTQEPARSKRIKSAGPVPPIDSWSARPHFSLSPPPGEAVLREGGYDGQPDEREKPDRSKISMHEAWELDHWTRELGVSRSELQRLVDKVGNSAAEVRKELARSKK